MHRDEIQAPLKSGDDQLRLVAMRYLALNAKNRTREKRREIDRLYKTYRKAPTTRDAIAAAERMAAITKELEAEAAKDRKLLLGRNRQ